MRWLKRVTALAILCIGASGTAYAIPIVETFESFATGTIITNQIAGLTISAGSGGNANIATASSPVVPGQPQGLYNDAPGVFAIGFEFDLIIDFVGIGTSIGAIVDFGVIGTGLEIVAYDGVGGTGNILGMQSTLTESFIGVNAAGIKSAVFRQAGQSPASWLIDNLTYDTGARTVPEPGTLALFALGVAGFGLARRKSA